MRFGEKRQWVNLATPTRARANALATISDQRRIPLLLLLLLPLVLQYYYCYYDCYHYNYFAYLTKYDFVDDSCQTESMQHDSIRFCAHLVIIARNSRPPSGRGWIGPAWLAREPKAKLEIKFVPNI